jgi:hypothetical protein
MAVTLVDPVGGLDRENLVSVPGVVIAHPIYDRQGDTGPLVVHVGRAATDRFLLAAISAGWSVVSVVGVDNQELDTFA